MPPVMPQRSPFMVRPEQNAVSTLVRMAAKNHAPGVPITKLGIWENTIKPVGIDDCA